VKLTGFVYRAHNPRWAFLPDSGQGAAATGGRFNPIGMPALYTALRFVTAWLEAQQAFPFKAQPMTLCAYEVDCEDILDLTDAATLAVHEIARDHLACG
jgi:RES domain-containing protein